MPFYDRDSKLGYSASDSPSMGVSEHYNCGPNANHPPTGSSIHNGLQALLREETASRYSVQTHCARRVRSASNKGIEAERGKGSPVGFRLLLPALAPGDSHGRLPLPHRGYASPSA